MYAVIEPYVSFADLQTEAMKKGLTCPSPLAGARVSALANFAWHGAYGNSWISGVGAQNLLAYEIVLPDGEIMKSGPPSLSDDEWFWNVWAGTKIEGFTSRGPVWACRWSGDGYQNKWSILPGQESYRASHTGCFY